MAYFCSELFILAWHAQICVSYNENFLNSIYLLASLKYMLLYICDKHIYLLTSVFYLVEVMPAEL